MGPDTAIDGEHFDTAYLVLSGTTTAARCPDLLRGLVGLASRPSLRCRHQTPRA